MLFCNHFWDSINDDGFGRKRNIFKECWSSDDDGLEQAMSLLDPVMDSLATLEGKPPAKIIKFVRHAVDDYGNEQYDKDPDKAIFTNIYLRNRRYDTGKAILKLVQNRCISMYDWEIENNRIGKEWYVLGHNKTLDSILGCEFEVQYNVGGKTKLSTKEFQTMRRADILRLPRQNYDSKVLTIHIELKRIGKRTKPCQLM